VLGGGPHSFTTGLKGRGLTKRPAEHGGCTKAGGRKGDMSGRNMRHCKGRVRGEREGGKYMGGSDG